jgi:hypothetical protein
MRRLLQVLSGERKQKTFELGDNKIVLQTLTGEEKAEIARMISGLDFLAQIENQKIPIVARSLVSINNIPIDNYDEVIQTMRRYEDEKVSILRCIEITLGKMDGEAINLLYSYYEELEQERVKERELLKNSSRVQKQEKAENLERSGKSVDTSKELPKS